MSASRQPQSSHVSHENVTQSSNPFQHYSQCLGNFTTLACTSPPNPPQRFACLHARTTFQMRLQHCPPISVLTNPHPYACVVRSQHAPNTAYHFYACGVPSQHAPDTTYPYACVVPSRHCLPSLCSRSALPTLLTILMLAECPPDMLPTPLILTLV
ncbi:hypothetical protein O181_115062 [Austropuccinia psidii MF-1]|uniref:Uncharacterized protein n=1 Tax=Austropuccinia psidii MF-1 TaxID=1389203 RepID=A0A9Q3PX00_9BASI|nr:hypothetical protein [Austropuccinia psidii MF-1]